MNSEFEIRNSEFPLYVVIPIEGTKRLISMLSSRPREQSDRAEGSIRLAPLAKGKAG